MIVNAIILFLSAAIPGAVLLRTGLMFGQRMQLFLVFAGAYLFSVTIIHLIPDLFLSNENPFNIGLYVLIGFFLQKVIENFTSGVEHGHVHAHAEHSVVYLLVALCLHSFLEGSIMTDSIHSNHSPELAYEHGSSPKILLGIVMHKIPAAVALMTLLLNRFKLKFQAYSALLIFALASPLGLFVSEFMSHGNLLPEKYMIIFFAIVAGSFLQISTTIFFETDPNHKLNWLRFGVSVFGALCAVLAQLVI
ncbi:ZIP family metal transporter [Roseivirga sp. UBA1976]|uniref:ZIP family metal transporter n=1 Tax=Roseivirga sp. UBA1976 TaxID=1947386 RepID=UPI00257A2B96|nr:ZIP family metal transporter [Roseivirga sp. UBA1976]